MTEAVHIHTELLFDFGLHSLDLQIRPVHPRTADEISMTDVTAADIQKLWKVGRTSSRSLYMTK